MDFPEVTPATEPIEFDNRTNRNVAGERNAFDPEAGQTGFFKAATSSALRNGIGFRPTVDALENLLTVGDDEWEGITPDTARLYLENEDGSPRFSTEDLDDIYQARSGSHFRSIIEQKLVKRALDDALANATGLSAVSGFLGAFLDPAEVLIGFGSAGVAGAFTAAKAAKAAKTLSTAARTADNAAQITSSTTALARTGVETAVATIPNPLKRATAFGQQAAARVLSLSDAAHIGRSAALAGVEGFVAEAAVGLTGFGDERDAREVLATALTSAAFGASFASAGVGRRRVLKSVVDFNQRVQKAGVREAREADIVRNIQDGNKRLEAELRGEDPGPAVQGIESDVQKSLREAHRISKAVSDGGLKATGQVLHRVLARIDPRISSKIDVRVTGLADVSGKKAAGSVRRNGDRYEVTLNPDLRQSQRSIRPILTAVHEVGHASFRNLSAESRGQFLALHSRLASTPRGRSAIADLFQNEAGIDPKRFVDDPRELFAEVFARESINKFGGPELVTGGRTLAKAAAVIRKSKRLSVQEKALLSDLVDEAGGFHGSAEKQTLVSEYLDGEEPINYDDVPPQDTTEYDPEVEYDVFDEDIPDRLNSFEGVLGAMLNRSSHWLSSSSGQIRKAGIKLVRDGGGSPDRIRREAMSEAITRQDQEVVNTAMIPMKVAFSKWKPDNGVKRETPWAAFRRFNEEVWDAVKASETELKELHPGIIEGVRAYTAGIKQIEANIEKSNIPEADKAFIRKKAGVHRSRVWSAAKLDELSERFGSDEPAIDLVHQAMIRATPSNLLNKPGREAAIRKLAKATVNNTRRRSRGTLETEGLSGMTSDQVREVLAGVGNLDAADVRHLVDVFGQGVDKPSFLIEKVPLDEQTTIQYGAETLSFKDVLETNASDLLLNHARSVHRHLADHDFRIAFQDAELDRVDVEGGDSFLRVPSIKDIEKRLIADIPESVVGRKFDAEKKRVEDIIGTYNLLQGKEQKTIGTASRVIRLIHSANFARVAAAFGLPQIAETVGSVWQNGFDAALASSPETRKIFKAIRSGEFAKKLTEDRGLLGEMLSMGIASDAMYQRDQRFGDIVGKEGFDNTRLDGLDKTQKVLDRVNKGISVVSGMAPITAASRLRAGTAAAHRLVWDMKEIQAGGKGKFVTRERLGDLGIADDMLDRVIDQMDKHSVTEQWKGTKEKIGSLGTNKWDDVEAADAISYAIRNMAERAVQTGDPGLSARWMDSSFGKIVTQFRGFGIMALSNHTTQFARFRDRQTLAGIGTQVIGSALSMAAIASIKSLGKEDPQAYLEEQLNPTQFGLNVFARTGFVNVGAMFIDSAVNVTTGGTLFEGARSSGASVGLFDLANSIPSVQLGQNIGQAGKALTSIVDPSRSLTKRGVRAGATLLPLANAPFLSQSIEQISAELPTTE